MAGTPDITVVVPTRDRWPVLGQTLDALARQELDGVEAEVVVVDNGSAGSPGDLPGARLVAEATPGAAAARNRGIAEARGELVLFMGDDCVPVDGGLVRGHVEAHRAGAGPRAVVGRIEWDPTVGHTEVMAWLERRGHMVDMQRLRRERPGPETFYTGNVSLPRRALLEVAGFDHRFSGYGYEDLDLALRLSDRGVGFEHRPELAVRHAHRYVMADSLARMEAVGRGGRLLHTLHDHRRPRPGPPAGRGRLAAGRALGALRALRREPPPRAPYAVRDAWLRAAHLAAFARGYTAPPLDDHPSRRGYGAIPRHSDDPRPPVSVVVPFLGDADAARELDGSLGRLRLRDGDEAIVADNGGTAAGGVAARVVGAPEERSSYYARNVGADAAANDWLLFLDADCRPPAELLEDLFREPIDERCGAVAGGVVAARGQAALVARYAASRRYLSQAAHMRDVHRPYGITANLLVRRAAFEDVGGFIEGLRSGGDQDFCWRIQDAGWSLAYREPAAVEHLHRERLVPLLRQMARYSAAIAWMERRAPGSSPRPRVAGRLARSAGGTLAWVAAGRLERAAFKAIDGAVVAAEAAGWLMSNDAPPGAPAPRADTALLVDEFPTAAAAAHARDLGGPAIEAARRPERPDRGAAGALRARFAEDDGPARRAAALVAAGAHGALLAAGLRSVLPVASAATVAARLRRIGVRRLHAAGAGPRAVLVAELLGVPLAGTENGAHAGAADPSALRARP